MRAEIIFHACIRAAPTESWRYCRWITEARAEEDFPFKIVKFRFVYELLSGRGNLSPVTDMPIIMIMTSSVLPRLSLITRHSKSQLISHVNCTRTSMTSAQTKTEQGPEAEHARKNECLGLWVDDVHNHAWWMSEWSSSTDSVDHLILKLTRDEDRVQRSVHHFLVYQLQGCCTKIFSKLSTSPAAIISPHWQKCQSRNWQSCWCTNCIKLGQVQGVCY